MVGWILGAALLMGALVPGMASATALASDELAAALEQADALEGEGRHLEVVTLLEPWADEASGEVLARLAYAILLDAMRSAHPQDVRPETMHTALDYALRAAELGRADAWNVHWLTYSIGIGVEQDPERAVIALRAGAQAGESGAMLNLLNQVYEGSDFIEADLDEACALAEALQDREHVGPFVAYFHGWMLIRGQCGLDVDVGAGVALIEVAAEAGEATARRAMGHALVEGWAGEPDPAAGLAWFERAAAEGDAYSQWRVGLAHAQGDIAPLDVAKAVALFEQAAQGMYPAAYTSLAVMHVSGQGVAQDFDRGRELYEQAVRLGETHALRSLSVMHALGQGMPVDPVEAQVYYLQYLHYDNEPFAWLEGLLEQVVDADGLEEAQQRFDTWVALESILESQ